MTLKQKINKPTSDADLYELMDGKVKIITYPELINYDTIEELLEPYDKVIILYLQKKGYGHWVCLFREGNLIEHFDSYGYFVDDELDFKMDEHFRKVNNMEYPLLGLLMYEAFDRYNMTFNEHKFQKQDNSISSCGRHCVVRLWYSHLPLKEYKKFMYSTKYTPDELVTLLTT